MMLLVAPGLALAAQPSAPPHPTFVTETDEPPAWTDCLWASAVMYLEAASGGSLVLDRRVLRAASGDTEGGSSLADLARGYAALTGEVLRFSPYGGDPLTWPALRARLEAGASALVLGSYALLPASLSHWDRPFAARGPAASGHAVMISAYDPASDAVWWMDPLGRGAYAGEWVPLEVVRAFIWTTKSGLVSAAAALPEHPRAGAGLAGPTPPAPLSAQDPAIVGATVAGATVEVSIPLHGLGSPIERIGDARLSVGWVPLDGADRPPIPPTLTGLAVSLAELRARVTLPTTPGRFRATLALVDPTGAPLSVLKAAIADPVVTVTEPETDGRI